MTNGLFIGWKVAKADPNIASFRHRALSIVQLLREREHRVEIFREENAALYDTVVFSKTYSAASLQLAADLKARGGKVVFDLCDNHFYNPYNLPRYQQIATQIRSMLGLADIAISSSAALARVIQMETGGAVDPIVIGDYVETVSPLHDVLTTPSDRRVLLWFGSHGSPNAAGGMSDLTLIAHELQQANARTPLELVVCSNNEAKFNAEIAPLPLMTRYVEWSSEAMHRLLAEAYAVVIPITPNPFTACKTHNRLTLALHAGVPVVADRLESYEEFSPWCTLGDWSAGLSSVLEHNIRARAQTNAARAYMDEHWSSEVVAGRWAFTLGLVDRPHSPGSDLVQSTPKLVGDTIKRKVGRLKHVQLQGAVDGLATDDLTGWVRPLSGPPRQLTVRLENEQGVHARTLADEARNDLALVGLSGIYCGFRFALHDLPSELLQEPFRIVVEETGWTVGDAYFKAMHLEPHSYLILPELQTASASAVEASGEAVFARPRHRAALDIASRAQDLLVTEIERFSLAVEEARQSAARLVVSIGDDPRHARRVIAALGPKSESR